MNDEHNPLASPPKSTETHVHDQADGPSTIEFQGGSLTSSPKSAVCPTCNQSLATGDLQNGTLPYAKPGNPGRVEQASEGMTADATRVIGRFQLLERVGQGSFGTVWRARDTQLDRVVALKIPHRHALEAGLDPERLEREARVAAQLRHAGIVRLYEVLTFESVPILVSDFIDGMTLKEMLETRRLTFRESALLTAQIAEALEHAHERGLVHRDVKPGNIMMERASKTSDLASLPGQEQGSTTLGNPIVVDFGLALRPDVDSVMTLDGQIIGTPAYMSPEQASGRGHHVDRRSDLYSLGVVLYQLVCDELPFRGSNVMVIQQVLNEDPRPPRRVNHRVPRDLETICLKALAKSPSRRYATAGDLASDLRRFLRGEPCLARPVGRLERVWLWALRNQGLAAATAGAAVLLFAVVIVSVLFAVREKKNSDSERKHALLLHDALIQSDQHLHDANYRLSENYLDRGLSLCERGEVARGMLVLARGMLAVPRYARDLSRALRTNLGGWQVRLDSIVAVRSHGASIEAVAFSPDGRLAASGGTDRRVRLWEGSESKSLGEPIVCSDLISSLAFSPDGNALAIACRDGNVRIWDVRGGHFLPTIFEHPKKVSSIAYSHDGKILATGSADYYVRFWDAATGQRLSLLLQHEHPIELVAFAPDDKTILSASDDGKIQIWDREDGKRRRGFTVPTRLLVAALSSDGRYLATGSTDGSARLWDVASFTPLHVLPHSNLVRAIAFSPDSQTLLTGGADKIAQLWDARNGTSIGPAAYHQLAIGAVTFSPDGTRLLTGSDDGVCQFRRFRSARSRSLELAHRSGVEVVSISPNGRMALTGTKPLDGTEGEVCLWDLATGNALARIAHSGMVTAAVFSPDGRTVATASSDQTVLLVNVATGNKFCPPLRHDGWVHAVAFNSDGNRLLTGCDDGTARLWEVPSGRYLDRSFAHEQAVLAVAFSPDGKLAATASADWTAKLWDIASGQERHVFHHQELVRTVAFSPNGSALLTASTDHTARLWHVDSGQPIGTPLVHQDDVLCAAFSPDGETVLTGSNDNTAQLWQVSTTRPLGPPLAHDGPVRAVAYSPDRMTVATASLDATVRLWDIATGRPMGPTLRHRGMVTGVAFSADGLILITGSRDNTARIWEVPKAFDGSSECSTLWVQTLCGMELAANEALALLSPQDWQKRSLELQTLGCAPLSER